VSVDTNPHASQRPLTEQLRPLWSGKWLILACLVVAIGAALIITEAQTEEYTATSRVLVENTDLGSSILFDTGGGEDPDVRAATNLDLASLPAIAQRVAQRLNVDGGSDEVLASIDADSKPQSRLLTIKARDESPERAALVANAFAEEYVAFRGRNNRRRYAAAASAVRQQITSARRQRPSTFTTRQRIRDLQDRLADLSLRQSLESDASVVQEATAPSIPTSPNRTRNLILGAMFGLIIGVVLAVVRERLDKRLRDVRQVRALFDGVPVLASLPEASGERKVMSAMAEGFRTLESNVSFMAVDRPTRSLLVTSASDRESRAATAANLALASAERGKEVMLVDGELRSPQLSRTLQMSAARGVSNYLSTQSEPLDDFRERLDLSPQGSNGEAPSMALSGRVWFVPSGPTPPNPGALMSQGRLEELLREATSDMDRVIINGAPLGNVGDMLPLASRADGVLVVVHLGRSRRDEMRRLADQLDQVAVRPLGIVLIGDRKLD
jgi:polysaccharide biosynthesis transport protein